MVHSTASWRRTSAATALGLAMVVPWLTACGAEEKKTTEPGPSAEVRACQADWRDLAASWETKGTSSFPSDLGPRWTSLAAGGAYQSETNDGEECEEQLAGAKADAARIEKLSTSLRRYDLEWQLNNIRPRAAVWINEARSTTGKQAKKQKRAAARAAGALKNLRRQAPLATADMEAGWQTAVRADLASPKQVRRVTASMTFLAGDSAPYRKGAAGLKTLRQLLK